MDHEPVQGKPLAFISHDCQDAPVAAALRDLLKECSNGCMEIFFSSDMRPSGGMPAGEWYQYIKDRLSRASDIVCLLTRRSINSHWVLFEAGMGLGYSKAKLHVIAFDVPHDLIPSPFSQYQWRDATKEGLNKLTAELIGRHAPADYDAIQRIPKRVAAFLKKVEGCTGRHPRAAPQSYAEALVLSPEEPAHFALAFEDARHVLAYNPPLNLLTEKESHRRIIAERMRTKGFEYDIIVGTAGKARLDELAGYWAQEAEDLVSGATPGVMRIKTFDTTSKVQENVLQQLVNNGLGDNIPAQFKEVVTNAAMKVALAAVHDEGLHTEIDPGRWIARLSDIRGLCFFAVTQESGDKLVLLYPLGAPFARTFDVPRWAIYFRERGVMQLMYIDFREAFLTRWTQLPRHLTLPQFYQHLKEHK